MFVIFTYKKRQIHVLCPPDQRLGRPTSVHLHCRTRIRVQTWIRIPNPMATLYYAEHVHTAQTRIATPYF